MSLTASPSKPTVEAVGTPAVKKLRAEGATSSSIPSPLRPNTNTSNTASKSASPLSKPSAAPLLMADDSSLNNHCTAIISLAPAINMHVASAAGVGKEALEARIQTLAATFDSSCVVVVARPYAGTASVPEVMATLASMAAAAPIPAYTTDDGAKGLITVLTHATSGTIEASFFAVAPLDDGAANQQQTVVVGTTNAVPILLVLCAPLATAADDKENTTTDAADVSSCDEANEAAVLAHLNMIGAPSSYLRKYKRGGEAEATPASIPRYTAEEGGVRSVADADDDDDEYKGTAPSISHANIPCAAMYTRSSSTGTELPTTPSLLRVVVKTKIGSAGIIHSMGLLVPVHTVPQLVRQSLRAAAQHQQEGNTSSAARYVGASAAEASRMAIDAATALAATVTTTSYTVIYAGASWCPPCMRILKELPSMMSGLSGDATTTITASITSGAAPFAPALVADTANTNTTNQQDIVPAIVAQVLKADYDTSPAILRMFGVKTIPTFIVIDNKKLAEGVVAAADEEGMAAMLSSGTATTAETATIVEAVPLAKAAVTKAYAGGEGEAPLQNSQRPIVSAYLQKVCAEPLTFTLDEDF